MAGLFLFSAGLVEVVFALSLKYNPGFSKPVPSLVALVAGGGSFYLLTLVIKTLPIGTAYAVEVALCGIFLFKASADWIRLASVAGIVDLKLKHVN